MNHGRSTRGIHTAAIGRVIIELGRKRKAMSKINDQIPVPEIKTVAIREVIGFDLKQLHPDVGNEARFTRQLFFADFLLSY